MLRGRRLLLPQSPLSGWRTTALSATTTTITTASARRASYTAPQVGSSIPQPETQISSNEEAAVKGQKEQTLQDLPNASGETNAKDWHAAQGSLVFRKYAITDNKSPVEKVYNDAKVSSRYLEQVISEEQSSGQRQGTSLRHNLASATSGTTQGGPTQLPLVKGDAANKWTAEWVTKVGERIGLRISKRDDVYFKLSLARRMGIKVNDRRLASPAMALAAIEYRERQTNKVSVAKNRQGDLVTEGTKPLFHPRNLESQPSPNLQSTEARISLSGLEGKGKAPSFPAPIEGLKAAQWSSGDLVGDGLRNSLKDNEDTSAQADAGEPTLAGEAQDQSESFFQRRGFSPGQFGPESLSYKGEKAPTGIRFTMRPTWLPFHRPNSHAKNVAMEEKNSEASSFVDAEIPLKDQSIDSFPGAQGAIEVLPKRKSGSEDSQPPQSSTDNVIEPVRQSNPLGSVPLPVPSSRPASLQRTDQASLAVPLHPRQSSQNIYGMLFPEETEADPNFSRVHGKSSRRAKSVARRRSTPNTLDGGIYKKLFPDESPQQMEPQIQSPPQSETTERQGPTSNQEEKALVPPEDSIFVSLRNEVRNWIPEEQRRHITAPEPGELGSHSTVMILSGLSNSLVDTDFYRILPESKHIEGWAGGLVKVVQARDALSHEPLGRYFLMFHSKPAADAYKAEVLRLHTLSKRLLHSFMGKGALAAADANPRPFLTEAEKADVRAFTLCPPTAPLVINVHMWNTNLVREIARDTNIADVVQALRPDVATPSKVLVTVNTIPGSKAGTGGGLTTDELWLTLRDDGRERGAPWVLSNLKEGIMPVKMKTSARHGKIDFRSEVVEAALEGPIYDELDMLAEPPTTDKADALSARRVTYDAWHDRNVKKDEMMDKRMFLAPESTKPVAKVERQERFNRFVVTFTQPAVSRRFVRSWHKRAIWDAYERRTVSIDAVALM
ncbi:hypothetical protein N0V93_004349 [Gnomoniopsis smithogilvyi]|uniref:Uncharacterized protein n=1 Tax=Gnomoniopsis smithogilvyi TaxID=1191159 RepID=A0A9W8YSF2_9PEZI|nr:hypothetical protein N0V93_004349 [Gnomoniopsis smithogilvyi]